MWSYFNPVNVHFGRGIREKIFDQIKTKKVLVVCSKRGKSQFLEDKIFRDIINISDITWIDSASNNPGISDIENHIINLNNKEISSILAFGGGSAIDTAKAISYFYKPNAEKFSIRDVVLGKAKFNSSNNVKLIAIPTTSGTGSEVTQFATIWDKTNKKKHSIDSHLIFPDYAYIDSELTDSLPIDITLSTGLDAINQSLESIWNKKANSFTVDLAIKALKVGVQALPKLIENPESPNLRDQMSECSLLAGLCISQTRTAICHSISYPLTAHYDIPHGLACAFTMLEVLKVNIANDDGRFDKLAIELMGPNNNAQNLPEFFKDFCERLGIAEKIKTYVSSLESIIRLIPEMYTKQRADNCLTPIDFDDIESIMKKSFIDN